MISSRVALAGGLLFVLAVSLWEPQPNTEIARSDMTPDEFAATLIPDLPSAPAPSTLGIDEVARNLQLLGLDDLTISDMPHALNQTIGQSTPEHAGAGRLYPIEVSP